MPEITDASGLAEVIEQAFDYRGDVTIVTRDGGRQVGYLFNRRRDVSAPFIQMLPPRVAPARPSSTPRSRASRSRAGTPRPASRTRPG